MMPDGWTPQPGAAYRGRSGAVWIGLRDGMLALAGSEPPLAASAEVAWESDGPLIRRSDASRLAAAYAREAEEIGCRPERAARGELADAALLRRRADVLWAAHEEWSA